MRFVLFLSRVAFIANIFFVISAVLQWKAYITHQPLVSTIVILGYFLAVFIFNPLANILYLTWLIGKKNLTAAVPKWLVMTNFIFLFLQILFIIFFVNDTFYN